MRFDGLTARKHWTGCVALVFMWIYAIPGVVAYRSHVFTPTEIALHLKGTAKKDWDQYQASVSNLQNCVARQDGVLADPTLDQSKLTALLSIRRTCSSLLSEENPPVTLAGFIGNWLLEIWVISYLGLLILISQWTSQSLQVIKWQRTISLGLFFYLAFNWSSWVRNFGSTQVENGRRVFSFVNRDISPASFVLQELRVLGMMILLGLLWERCSEGYIRLKEELPLRSVKDL